MSLSRREFMKLFGTSLASLLLARCQATPPTPTPEDIPTFTCYEPPPPPEPTFTPVPASLSPHQRLRLYWLRFDELAEKTRTGENRGEEGGDDPLGRQWLAEHRTALDELVAAGEIEGPVADLVQEAYTAAVYHVWRLTAPITCYEPLLVDYAPASASALVEQSKALDEVAIQGTVEPATLAQIRAALEHDLAFYALTPDEEKALYDQILKAYRQEQRAIPDFEAVALEIPPEAQGAAQFLLELLGGKE